MADEQAWAELGLPRGSTPEVVKAHWRELARVTHPDLGGDPERFMRLQAAAKACLEEAAANAGEPIPCPTCRGTGKRVVEGNFRRLSMACPTCGGSGAAGDVGREG